MDHEIHSTTAAPQFLTTEALAIRWAVSPGHLNNLRSLGKGCTYVKLGAAVRYRLSDVEAYEAKLPKFEAVAA